MCPVSADAPINEFILAENHVKSKNHYHINADKGLKAPSRQICYLHEYLIPLVMFSPMKQKKKRLVFDTTFFSSKSLKLLE